MDIVAEQDTEGGEQPCEPDVGFASDSKGSVEVPPPIPAVGEASAAATAPGAAPTQPDFAAVQEAVLLVIDESIALSLSMESAAAPVEKQLALRDAVSTMLTHIGGTGGTNAEKIAALRACLKVLIQVLLNAKVRINSSTNPGSALLPLV
jgi:hypothetical protein